MTNVSITIGGLESQDFSGNQFTNPERTTDYHKLLVDIAYKEEATCYSVYITITDTVYMPETLVAITVKFMTLFYIQADDYSFLDQPTSQFTIDIMNDLVQVAIAHTRPYMLMEGRARGLFLTIPYFSPSVLREYTMSSLLAARN